MGFNHPKWVSTTFVCEKIYLLLVRFTTFFENKIAHIMLKKSVLTRLRSNIAAFTPR